LLLVMYFYDSNTNLITYDGNWGTAGVQEEFNSTTHFTRVAGSTATFIFNSECKT
jgi:hypothetical protein